MTTIGWTRSAAENSGDRRTLTEVDELRKNFFKGVGGNDQVVLCANQATLEKRVAQIAEKLETARTAIVEDVEYALERVIESLVRQLAEPARKMQSDKLRGAYGETSEGAEAFVRKELVRAFPTAEAICHRMTISLAFKDVTYEMLSNQAFKDRVLTHFDPSSLPNGLKDEYQAARRRVDCQATGNANKHPKHPSKPG